LYDPLLYGAHGWRDRLGVVMRGHCDEDVYLANVSQLANDIVAQHAVVCHLLRSDPTQSRRSLHLQTCYAPLVDRYDLSPTVRILAVEFGAQFLNNDVGFRQIFARGAFALD